MKFITEEEFKRIQTGAITLDEVNEIFSRAHNHAVEFAIRKMPSIISRLLVSIPAQKKLTLDFYEKNPEFKDHKDIVIKTVQDVENDNPGKNYDEILDKAAILVRKHIGCSTKAKSFPMDKPTEVNLDGNGVL